MMTWRVMIELIYALDLNSGSLASITSVVWDEDG